MSVLEINMKPGRQRGRNQLGFESLITSASQERQSLLTALGLESFDCDLIGEIVLTFDAPVGVCWRGGDSMCGCLFPDQSRSCGRSHRGRSWAAAGTQAV